MFHFTCIAPVTTSGVSLFSVSTLGAIDYYASVTIPLKPASFKPNHVADKNQAGRFCSLASHYRKATHMVSTGLLCWVVVTMPTVPSPTYPISVPAFLSNHPPGEKPTVGSAMTDQSFRRGKGCSAQITHPEKLWYKKLPLPIPNYSHGPGLSSFNPWMKVQVFFLTTKCWQL